jgi:hypothetical protein
MVAVLCAVVLAGSWGLYQAGHSRGGGGGSGSDARAELRQMQQQLSELTRANRELVRRNAQLERGYMVEEAASRRLQESLRDMQSRLQSMDEELTFYRNIVSPENLESGLHIHSFTLEPGGANGEYVYKAVLTQIRGSGAVEGTLELLVQGRQGDQQGEVAGDALGEASRGFSFRYFQNLEGRIRIPEGLDPEVLKLTLTTGGNRPRVIEHEYGWDSSLKAGG